MPTVTVPENKKIFKFHAYIFLTECMKSH
jgi:hypothetical protein